MMGGSAVCEHEIEVEDLAIGLLEGAEAADARRHLATCSTCQAAHERFLEERAIFSGRPLGEAHPIAEPELVERVVAIAAAQDQAKQGKVVRFVGTVVAFAACAAAVVLSVWMHEHTIGGEATATATVPTVFQSSDTTAPTTTVLSLDDQTLACAFPMSGSFASGGFQPASTEVTSPRSAAADNDQHATCEAPLSSSGSSMLSWRVTSSYATP